MEARTRSFTSITFNKHPLDEWVLAQLYVVVSFLTKNAHSNSIANLIFSSTSHHHYYCVCRLMIARWFRSKQWYLIPKKFREKEDRFSLWKVRQGWSLTSHYMYQNAEKFYYNNIFQRQKKDKILSTDQILIKINFTIC